MAHSLASHCPAWTPRGRNLHGSIHHAAPHHAGRNTAHPQVPHYPGRHKQAQRRCVGMNHARRHHANPNSQGRARCTAADRSVGDSPVALQTIDHLDVARRGHLVHPDCSDPDTPLDLGSRTIAKTVTTARADTDSPDAMTIERSNPARSRPPRVPDIQASARCAAQEVPHAPQGAVAEQPPHGAKPREPRPPWPVLFALHGASIRPCPYPPRHSSTSP